MPFIDCKISKKLTDAEKDSLKTALGKKISVMHKPESYLMVGICDGYDLYFAGKKLDNGAYLEISLFGSLSQKDCENMTAEVCDTLKTLTGVNPAHVYVTYRGVDNWGWNGTNF